MLPREAVDLFQTDDLIGIGMAADAVRRGLSLFLEYAAELGLAPRKPSLEMLDEPAIAV